ncbi:hypothetical protein HK100_002786 [Physocladia obscura]|uniref:F-box domain-containing protein n=1 Tax=Physocladia obscura TaxID=109957 RepID=A0AAD5T8L5_9FUNG|nr:hypothetical protein HK100_002786 [Physocladia obscura]
MIRISCTEFNQLSYDLLAVILVWIHPGEVIKLRRVCKRFQECINSQFFAVANLSNFAPIKRCIYSHRPNEFDRFWFLWPKNFQCAYAKSLSYFIEIRWFYVFGKNLLEIPAAIGLFTNLKKLELGVGKIPINIQELVELEYLSLSVNELTGSIPKEIGKLEKLIEIDINMNKLSGSLPQELANLNLISLDLRGNMISGGIPPELGTLRNAETVFLQDNLLTGTIPPDLGNMESLRNLNVSRNKLSGEIPAALCNAVNLRYLFLNNNELCGKVPVQFGMLHLWEMRISHNRLSGPIPKILRRVVKFSDRTLMGTKKIKVMKK